MRKVVCMDLTTFQDDEQDDNPYEPGSTGDLWYQSQSISIQTGLDEAVKKVKNANPDNIQEVAASQLSIINNYYISGLEQSQQSFRWSLIWGGIGFAFLLAAVAFVLFRQPSLVATISVISGAIVEIIAAVYLYLYKHASDQLAAFRTSLEGTQRLLLANSMCEKLTGEKEQTTRSELIHMMAESALNVPSPLRVSRK